MLVIIWTYFLHMPPSLIICHFVIDENYDPSPLFEIRVVLLPVRRLNLRCWEKYTDCSSSNQKSFCWLLSGHFFRICPIHYLSVILLSMKIMILRPYSKLGVVHSQVRELKIRGWKKQISCSSSNQKFTGPNVFYVTPSIWYSLT